MECGSFHIFPLRGELSGLSWFILFCLFSALDLTNPLERVALGQTAKSPNQPVRRRLHGQLLIRPGYYTT